MNDMLTICGLWTNISKNGNRKYLAGSLGRLRIMIFKNENKKSDNSPDYTLCVAVKEQREHIPNEQRGEFCSNEPSEAF